jgi:hypothetical protein
MPGVLTSLARRVLPDRWLIPAGAVRARRHSHALNASWGIPALSRRLWAASAGRVAAGPFAGLQLPEAATAEHLGPYLLGVYEHELHAFWDGLRPPSRVVNVGSKFGYYAVGLSRRFGVPAVAFDADGWAREMTAATARANGVADRVTIRGACRRADLAGHPPGTLLMIDCDGCEMALLAPPLPRGLDAATIVVEVHEMAADGAGATLHAWLSSTHEIDVLPSDEAARPAPPLEGFSDQERGLAVHEIRPPQTWLVCRPKALALS